MPTDHGEVELTDVRVPADAVLGEVDRGLEVAQTFLHENRIRQAASSLGAAQYCIDRAAEYAAQRTVFGKPLSVNQAVQWPLAELEQPLRHPADLDLLGALGDPVAAVVSVDVLERLVTAVSEAAEDLHGPVGGVADQPVGPVVGHRHLVGDLHVVVAVQMPGRVVH